MHGYLVGSIDVAALALTAFVLFFIGLVFWLRREDRREGYPLEDELTGALESPGGALHTRTPKVFRLPFDRGTAVAPRRESEPVEIAARRRENFAGAPYHPIGEGMPVGIGPGAFAQRAQWPDLDAHGRPRIVPLAGDDHVSVSRNDRDPRGMAVYGADHARAGTVTELWIDRSEHVIRYLEVDTGTGSVLAPMAMANVRAEGIVIDAINAAHFAGVPRVSAGGQITRDEEERIIAYYGGGYLYANLDRQEPWL